MSDLLRRLGIVPGPGFRFGRNHSTDVCVRWSREVSHSAPNDVYVS